MADEIIGYQIVVKTQAGQDNVTTLKQDINNLQAAIERASKTDLKININGFDKSIQEAQVELNKTIAKLEELNRARIDVANKSANEQVKAEQKVSDANNKAYQNYINNEQKKTNVLNEEERKRELSQSNSYDKWKDKEKQRQQTGNPALEQKQSNKATGVSRAQTQSELNDVFGQKQQTQMVSYAQQLSNLNKLQEHWYQLANNTGDEKYTKRFNAVGQAIEKVTAKQVAFNKIMGESSSIFGSLADRIYSHSTWIASGALIGGLLGIPTVIMDITRETEQLGLKIKQNLELADKYRDNQQGLESDIKHLSDVATTFSIGYGVSVKDTMDMMQVLSRRFKSPEELTYYTNLVMIMHKLDFVEPKKAAEDLEAVVLSMGLDFQGAKRFIDEFSVAVHVARITGTELLSGLQRSGATFQNMNFNTAQAIAMISTLSTVTAKAGANIGASLNSVLINIDFKKAAEALKTYSVDVYEVVDGHTRMRDGAQVWREIAGVFNGLDDDKANEFANAISGGKFRANDLRALLSNWNQFEKILDDINTKASPQLTTSLMQTGLESFNTNLIRLQASLQTFGMTIGNETMPQLKSLIDGLSKGLFYLNENRDAVSRVVRSIGDFVIALTGFKLAAMASNTQLARKITLIDLLIGKKSGFMAGLGAMSTSIMRFATSLMFTTGKFLIFMAIADKIATMAGQASDRNAELDIAKDYDDNNIERIAKGDSNPYRDKINRRNSLEQQIEQLSSDINSASNFGGLGVLEENSAITDKRAQIDSLKKELKDVQGELDLDRADFETKNSPWSKKLKALNDESEEVLSKKPPMPEIKAPAIPGQDLGTNKTPKETSAPTDASYKENNLQLKRYTKNLFNILDKNKTEYEEALEQLQTFTALYGENNVEAIKRQQQLEQGRIQQIQQEQAAIITQKQQLMNVAGDIIDKYPEMQQVVSLENKNVSLPTEDGVDIDNVKPAVKSAASALIQEISSQLGVSPVVTSGYREGDPGGHGRGDKLDIAWDNLQWGTDDFNMAVQMAEKAGFTVYAVPHGTGPHLDINGGNLQDTMQLSFQSNDMTQDKWKGMSKDERLKWRLDNKDESQSSSVLGQTLSQLDELNKKANEKTKELAKMQADLTKRQFAGVFDEDKQRSRRLGNIGTQESIDLTNVNKNNPFSYKDETGIKLYAEIQRYDEYYKRARELREELEKLRITEVKLAEQRLKDAKNIDEIADATKLLEAAKRGETAAIQKNTDEQLKNSESMHKSLETQKTLAQLSSMEIKTFWADALLDMGKSGSSFKDTMKDLWNQIAKDAMYSLFKIEGYQKSVGTKMLGKGKSGGGVNVPAGNLLGDSGMDLFADGGVTDKPAVFGDDGKEVAIPLENNTQNSEKLLKYANSKLGSPLSKPSEYVSYFKNPDIANSAVNVNVQRDNAHIAELQTANKLMIQQNQLLVAMLNKNSSGGNTVAQPIVMSNQMSDDELQTKLNRMRNNGYKV